jgi:hypothetical protein
MADRGHQGKAYEDCRRYVLAEYDSCFRCGLPVDKELSGRHLWGPTLDLIVPHSKGGPMTRGNSALSHNRCNAGYRDGRRLRPLTTVRVVRRGRYSPSGSC